MKKKFFNLACCFTFMWILGEVFKSPHQQNLVQAITMTIAYAIYLGIHLIFWKQFKSLFNN